MIKLFKEYVNIGNENMTQEMIIKLMRKNSRLGMSPSETFKELFGDESYENFFKSLRIIDRGVLQSYENGINKKRIIVNTIMDGLKNGILLKDIIKSAKITINDIFDLRYITDEEKNEIVVKTIINGLKNEISLKDIIKTEFKGIYIDDILNFLTDDDKKLINQYNLEISNSPENANQYNKLGKTKKYKNNVVDPYEDFIDSYPYIQYSNKIRQLKH